MRPITIINQPSQENLTEFFKRMLEMKMQEERERQRAEKKIDDIKQEDICMMKYKKNIVY